MPVNQCISEQQIAPKFFGVKDQYTNVDVVASRPNNNMSFDPCFFIGLEMSLVPQVEKVFVERTQVNGFEVSVIVDARDSEVRECIFVREQAIMEELRHAQFNFSIIARDGARLEEIGIPSGDVVFKR